MIYCAQFGEWNVETTLDLRQWMFGFNLCPAPWPMWNVFFGPMRFGGCKTGRVA